MGDLERNILRKHPAKTIVDDDAFCQAVAEIQGEFLVIHPFREGNARTIKLVTDLLAAQTGRPLLVYDQTEAGREAYIIGASQSFRRNYRPLELVIRKALAEGRRAPSISNSSSRRVSLRQRRQALNNAIALHDIENARISLLVIPQPGASLLKNRAFAKIVSHTPNIPYFCRLH